MNAKPLNLKPDPAATTEPIIRMTSQFVKEAIRLKADAILFDLDVELHLKTHEKSSALFQMLREKSITKSEFEFEVGKLPLAFGVTYMIAGQQDPTPPASGELFESVIRILLLAAGVSHWTKGEISAELETTNPTTKWILESKDLKQKVQLRRIRAT